LFLPCLFVIQIDWLCQRFECKAGSKKVGVYFFRMILERTAGHDPAPATLAASPSAN
jgi:hypothetical protein